MFNILEFDFILKIIIALGLGALIGFERELYHKPAGLRTNILVILGSMLAAYVSFCVSGTNIDPTRIASNILTGLGFIGGGVILHSKGSVHGITTAACIWVCGILGLAIGFNYYTEALVFGFVTFCILFGLGRLELYLKKRKKL